MVCVQKTNNNMDLCTFDLQKCTSLAVHETAARGRPVSDWDNLRYFLELARAGTLAAAARRLAVEHTTVSRRIQALEKRMGAALFRARGYGTPGYRGRAPSCCRWWKRWSLR